MRTRLPGITDDLKQLAEIALKTAQTEMNDKGALTPTFLVRLPDGGLDVVRFEGEAGKRIQQRRGQGLDLRLYARGV